MITTTLTIKRTLVLITAIVAVLAAASFTMAATPAHAQTTFTVNTTGDQADLSPGDGVCKSGSGFGDLCTLRAAIQEANATEGADAIHFNIPNIFGEGVKTVKPASQLPTITEEVTIDGYTQGDATSSPDDDATENTLEKGTDARLLVELDGSGIGASADGLEINGPNVVVRGLVINRFILRGIAIDDGAQNVKVEGNFIGTDPSGTQDEGNFAGGIRIDDSINNTVGGATPGARNLISGNGDPGFSSPGIKIEGGPQEVVGNLIGTSKDGASPLGNFGDGVDLVGSTVTLGGNTGASANTIAFNGGDGVRVLGGASNSFLRNSIFSNGDLGIDLGFGGVTPNDPADADVGANNLQNFPLISSARTSRKATTIRGTLSSTPGTYFTVEFFSNPSSTDAEGMTFIGERVVTTNASGNVSFSFKPLVKVRRGAITATATDDSTGDTSEFSAPKKVRRV